jgi:hypothetical protein
MRIIGCLLIFVSTFTASALTPPAPGQVSDEDAVRLLKTAYTNEAVGFAGDWSARQRSPDDDDSEPVDASRTVCADSGRDTHGPRMIAVCTSFADAGHVTPGLVDLWLLLDPRGEQAARVGASKRDIASGGFGTPGDVSFFAIGPARTAFALDSGYSNMGWSTNVRTLYFAESDRFDTVLSYGAGLDNSGACDPSEDASCKKKAISLECSLRAETGKAERGFYPLRIDVSGERGGSSVKLSIAIPFEKGAYRPPQAQLASDGCDQGF